MLPKFHNKDGTLTRYALSCGYIQEYKTDTRKVTLTERHNTLFVTYWDTENKKELYFQGFYLMKSARKQYNKIVKEIKQNENYT